MRHEVYNSWTIEVPGRSQRTETDDGYIIFDLERGQSPLRIFTVIYLMHDPLAEYVAQFQCGDDPEEAEEDLQVAIGETSAIATLRDHLAGTGEPQESAYLFSGHGELAGYCSIGDGPDSEIVFHALVAAPDEILNISADCDRDAVPLLLQIWNSATNEIELGKNH